ncbi:hypothetical protein E4U45_003840 [Claviceps purpurea]|nr:hypothetical protein E4U45_003840 [Claviceps purpurea]
MPFSDFNDKTAAFLGWFHSLPGTTFSDAVQIVDLRSRGAGRGMVATRDIPADTTLFTIPRSAIITPDTSMIKQHLNRSTYESHGDQDDQQALDSWSFLILTLMHEYFQGNDSLWKNYLDILPDAFDTPMFWTDQELAQLQGSATSGKIGKDTAEDMFRRRLIPIIRENRHAFKGSEDMSAEDLVQLAHRMGSTIMAYAFDLESDEQEGGGEGGEGDDDADSWVEDREGKTLMGMVPMADILNADAEFNTHIHHGENELTATTLRDVRAGDEILNFYGPHPNSELLRRYGYVTPKHARYDVVEIPWTALQASLSSVLGIPHDAITKAMETLSEEDELEDVFVLERNTGEPNPDGTFPATAPVIDGMPEDMQAQLKAVIKVLQKMDGNLIPDKRKRDGVLQSVMAEALRAVASRYTSTVAEDEELLRRGDLSSRHRMAIVVRLGEKRLIEEAFAQFSGMAAGDETCGDDSAAKRTKRSD